MKVQMDWQLDVEALKVACEQVSGLRDVIVSMGRTGMAGINPPVFGALLELGLVCNAEGMKAAAAELLKPAA